MDEWTYERGMELDFRRPSKSSPRVLGRTWA